MSDISQLPHQLDEKKRQCRIIVETPRGSRIKFKWEPEARLFGISKFLPKGFVFPFEFGFVPSTIAEDGDPLDALVLMDEPSHVGCLLQVRLLGVWEDLQTQDGRGTPDPRLIAVPVQSFDYAHVARLNDLPGEVTKQMVEFLEIYNKNAGKQDRVTATGDAERAVALIKEATRRLGNAKGAAT